jgi:sirohydrochlorin cobaltochelatase
MPKTQKRALILLGHGSSHHSESSKPVREAADTIRAKNLFNEVAVSFWKEEPKFNQALSLVSSDLVFVVPYFMSNGYYTETIIPRELELSGKITTKGSQTIIYCEPIGTHPRITEILLQTANDAIQKIRTGTACRAPTASLSLKDTSLILIGHGTEKNENSARSVLDQMKKLSNHFAEVLPAFIDEAPFDYDVIKSVKSPYVIALPFFISNGPHTQEDIPKHLGIDLSRGNFSPASQANSRIKGLWYTDAIGTNAIMHEIVLDRVNEFENGR